MGPGPADGTENPGRAWGPTGVGTAARGKRPCPDVPAGRKDGRGGVARGAPRISWTRPQTAMPIVAVAAYPALGLPVMAGVCCAICAALLSPNTLSVAIVTRLRFDALVG